MVQRKQPRVTFTKLLLHSVLPLHSEESINDSKHYTTILRATPAQATFSAKFAKRKASGYLNHTAATLQLVSRIKFQQKAALQAGRLM
ncbi:MAG: hypothetical protein ACK5JO_03580 [Halodesulfovibrio sp.]